MKKKENRITRQDLFVKNFTNINDKKTFLNAYQSAIASGYSEGTAKTITYDIFTRPNYAIIREKLSQYFTKIKTDELTPQFVLNKLQEILKLFEDPEKMKKYYAKTSDIVRILELLGKYLKMFTEKIELEGNVVINIYPPAKN